MSSDPPSQWVTLETLVRDVVQQAGVPGRQDEVLRVVRFCSSEALDQDAAGAGEGVYDLRLGGWNLEGRRAAVQTMITAAILAVAAR